MTDSEATYPAARRVRAFFAPVNRATEAPTIFDPARDGCFDLDAPPAPWIDLGWIENFRRTPATKIEPITAGPAGAAAAQFRSQLAARVEFEFRRWGKLQMALAAGVEHMNVLATAGAASRTPSGGAAIASVPLLAGATPTELPVGAAAAQFTAGEMVAVDTDYTETIGYVGLGISAAYVRDPADVSSDLDYTRRVTFNVGRISVVTADTLILEAPLLAGAPLSDARVQKVIGFVDREGGRFFQQWSALFVVAEETGGRICFHYPRLEAAAPAGEVTRELAPLTAWSLRANFIALPHSDSRDSQPAVCWRTYFPGVQAPLY